jgi:hypothetical protein
MNRSSLVTVCVVDQYLPIVQQLEEDVQASRRLTCWAKGPGYVLYSLVDCGSVGCDAFDCCAH